MTTSPTLGRIARIDERTVLVLGQELDIAHDQPDVANAVVHRAGEVLVIVDTGVTEPFRTALRAAVDEVGEWSQILLLTTHGHLDHVGNNDLVDEIAAERGVPVEHWVPAHDLAQMLDPVAYWERNFTRLTGIVPMPAPPALAAKKVVSLFAPMRPFGATTRIFEERPLELLRLGTARMSGWSFAAGSVHVLRSQGHCAGHVIVHLRDAGLVHLGDEANSGFAVMRDADQLKLQTVLGNVAAAVGDGVVSTVTGGHDAGVRRGNDALAHLETLEEQSVQIPAAALEVVAGRHEVDPVGFAAEFAPRVAEMGATGPNPNPTFTGMMVVNVLAELGLRPPHAGTEGVWELPAGENPEPVPGRPHGLKLVPAAAEMVAWKLRHRDR